MHLIGVLPLLCDQHQPRTANMKGKAGSDDGLSKDRVEKHPGPEEDEAARPTTSLRKLRSQGQVESPVPYMF